MKFHIGQRVVWTVDGYEYFATIRERQQLLPFKTTRKKSLVYPLCLDGFGERGAEGYLFAAPEEQLRPLYDGQRVAAWKDCAWKPGANDGGAQGR